MRYYLGLGGNLGDVAASMADAVDALRARGAEVPLISSCYATAPMGEHAGDRYLNAALGVDADWTPLQMLRICQEIETSCGRVRTIHWGPRTLDIDILLAGEETVHSEALTVPHPGLACRRFAIDPLCEIAPTARHPGLGVDVSEMRRWLLPRPLEVTVRTSSGTEVASLVECWPAERRAKVRMHETTAPSVESKSGWFVDCIGPASSMRPRSVALVKEGNPLSSLDALIAAMTDDPVIVASPALDRVRQPR